MVCCVNHRREKTRSYVWSGSRPDAVAKVASSADMPDDLKCRLWCALHVLAQLLPGVNEVRCTSVSDYVHHSLDFLTEALFSF